jgi:hypothetical protein
LADENQSATPPISIGCHQFGGADPTRHVDIVTASMHNWDRRSRIALNDDMAGKRQPRFFCDRKGVHVSAQKYGGTLAVAQHSDHSGAAHARRHFISHCLDAIRQLGCRLLLMHGQLGGSMEIEVEGLHLGINRVDFRARWSCPRYGLGLRGGASKQEHTTGQRG